MKTYFLICLILGGLIATYGFSPVVCRVWQVIVFLTTAVVLWVVGGFVRKELKFWLWGK